MNSTTMVIGRKTISIDIQTWERLKSFGKFGESFDDLLNRLMNEVTGGQEKEVKQEEPPTMVIEAPPNYERTQLLPECPICISPNPYLVIHIPVREYGNTDMNLYVSNTSFR